MHRPLFLVLPAILIAYSTALGQNYSSDTAFVALARKNAVRLYTLQVGVVSNVYNGSEYVEYRPQRDEHPYLTQDWIYGSVDYAGERYESVPLLYDLSTDQLITMYTSGNAIQMVREKVKSFRLGNRTFIRLDNSHVGKGFYERLHSGKAQYYVRRQKELYKRLNGTVLMNTFELSETHYIVKDGVFHSFKGKGGLLRLLDDQKAEMKKFMREENIQFNLDREGSTVRVLKHYDQISK